ncbi:hypothetical protein LTR56_006185 [Elasticomyces elasticus]|nr:hypothetical protein LTR56_006185 [Elasticomyces elasticus]KAK4928261.1 hypothetical protein LTR49_004938 [Elasticomyces elasticus]KAK5763824.1 hypothetical protein LTS12_005942 [Elasticomyces elasticus]
MCQLEEDNIGSWAAAQRSHLATKLAFTELGLRRASYRDEFFAQVISNTTAIREVLMQYVRFVSRFDDDRTNTWLWADSDTNTANGNLYPLRKAALQLQTRLGGSSQDFLEAWRVLVPRSKPEQLREVAKTKLIIALDGVAELFGDSSDHDRNSDFFSALCRTLTLLRGTQIEVTMTTTDRRVTNLLGDGSEAHVAQKISPYQRFTAPPRVRRVARQPFCALFPDAMTSEDSLYHRYEPKTEDELKVDNTSEPLFAASEFAVPHTRVCIDAPNRWVTTASLVNYGRPIWSAYWNYVKVHEAKSGAVEGGTQEELERLVVSRLLSGDRDRVARLLSAPQVVEQSTSVALFAIVSCVVNLRINSGDVRAADAMIVAVDKHLRVALDLTNCSIVTGQWSEPLVSAVALDILRDQWGSALSIITRDWLEQGSIEAGPSGELAARTILSLAMHKTVRNASTRCSSSWYHLNDYLEALFALSHINSDDLLWICNGMGQPLLNFNHFFYLPSANALTETTFRSHGKWCLEHNCALTLHKDALYCDLIIYGYNGMLDAPYTDIQEIQRPPYDWYRRPREPGAEYGDPIPKLTNCYGDFTQQSDYVAASPLQPSLLLLMDMGDKTDSAVVEASTVNYSGNKQLYGLRAASWKACYVGLGSGSQREYTKSVLETMLKKRDGTSNVLAQMSMGGLKHEESSSQPSGSVT